MLKCKDIIGMFDEYINNNLDKTSSDDFTEHIKRCENCRKDFELYKAYFSDTNIENTYAFPTDLNAKIKYQLNNIKKEKKFLFRPKIVLAYATSISFLFLIGIFGSTYIQSLKVPLDNSNKAQISDQTPIATNKPAGENKAVLTAPKVAQAPTANPTAPKGAMPTATPASPNTAPSAGETIVATPNTTEAPTISTPIPAPDTAISEGGDAGSTSIPAPAMIPESEIAASDSANDANATAIPSEQPEQATMFKSASSERSMNAQKINVEISEAYKKELLQKYSYTEISTDLYHMNTNIEALKKDYPDLTIINSEFEEGFIIVQFISLPTSAN